MWKNSVLLTATFAIACGPTTVRPGGDPGVFIESQVVETHDSSPELTPHLDQDGDRLSNADELAFGTDPYDVDSDDDGYRDGDEVFEGSDPLDDSDVIYRGGWPYNPAKHSIEVVSPTPEFGTPFAWFSLQDQYSDKMDLFDMLGDEAHVLVLVFGSSCKNCQDISAYLAGHTDEAPRFADTLEEHLAADTVRLVQVMTENDQGGPISHDDVESWHATYPMAGVPILCDDRGDMADYAVIGDSLPAAYVLDSDGRIVHMQVNTDDMTALEWIAQNL